MGDKKEKTEIPSIDNDYDPYSERNVDSPTNDLESFAHIMKGILGTGVLALPEGFSFAGGMMAIIYCVLNAFLCTSGMHILVTGFYMVGKAYHLPSVTYADAMKLGTTLGPNNFPKTSHFFSVLTNALIISYQGGVLCVYMLFVGVSIEMVTNNIVGKEISLGFYLLLMIIPCMLINSVKNLKYLAPFSYFSLGVTVMVLGMIFYYVFRESLPSYLDERKLTNDIFKLPMFFGTTLFAFTSVPVVVSVENSMKNPKHFHRIYDLAILILLILYLCVGFFSYWKWGEDLKPVVILNFPMNESPARAANYLYALAIFLSIGLNGIVPVRLVMDTYVLPKLESPYPILWEYVFRLGFIALGLFLAISVPFIGTVISLLGAIALSCLTLIFPAILDICWRHQKDYGPCHFRLLIDLILIFYGIFGLTTGVYVNVRFLIEKMTE
ncbi:proton-coupled amino acid transporter-like protein CG1139 [Onthophagus taurus]|uniref:proton-coupled amino acid transporter-like protein CG1139 n=1 Tax=Onthophagus taurus TaxID=166361 RepID=UPI0039BE3878